MEKKEGGKMTLIITCFGFVRMQTLIRSSYSDIEGKVMKKTWGKKNYRNSASSNCFVESLRVGTSAARAKRILRLQQDTPVVITPHLSTAPCPLVRFQVL
jgi:hypothetical protein